MNRYEYLAVLTALELLKDENGDVWYSYDENEKGTPIYLDELIKQIDNEYDNKFNSPIVHCKECGEVLQRDWKCNNYVGELCLWCLEEKEGGCI